MSWLRGIFATEVRYPTSDSPSALAAELIEAEAMANELVDYLLSDRLFRQIAVETPEGSRRPKMTLGNLYERVLRLRAATKLGTNDSERLVLIEKAWNAARNTYSGQFKRKLRRELDSYLKNWKYYLDQRLQNPEQWDADYQVELRNRQRVQLVLNLLGPEAPQRLMEDLRSLERDNGVEVTA